MNVTTKLLEYPTDILQRLDQSQLDGVRRQFESDGWKIITWGADSHDAVEFTIYKREEEDNDGLFVSLFLAVASSSTITQALEVLVERNGRSRKIQFGTETKEIFTADDVRSALERGMHWRETGVIGPPLLVAVGAADLALANINDLITQMRERALEARSDATSRVLARLQDELPEQFSELLRERFTTEELRRIAEGYWEAATNRYNELVERGEATLARLRSQGGGFMGTFTEGDEPAIEIRERTAKLVGVELPRKESAKKAPAKKATPKKAPAKKGIAKKAPADGSRRRSPK
jgi:heparin binding hemagglutinin HbhA